MVLRFYYAPMSTASVTEAVLAELALPCERVRLDIDAGDTRRSEFLEINPNGRVPTIVHEGVAIWESSAITMYLGELFGVDAGLYPKPGPKRGEAMKWIVWASATLAEAAGRMSASLPTGQVGAVQPGSVDYAPDRDPDCGKKARADIDNCLRILSGALSDGAFLNGAYSLADTHLYVLVEWIVAMGADLTPFPKIDAWIARCAARPALAERLQS